MDSIVNSVNIRIPIINPLLGNLFQNVINEADYFVIDP